MESWDPYNYYTTNPKEWVKLKNLSTAERNIGFLPAGVVAIPGPLNSSYNFTAGTLVTENASRTNFGSRDIEKVIFGAASGLVLLWALPWFFYHLWKGTLLSPRGSTDHGEPEADDHPRPTSPSGTTVFGGYVDSGFMPANVFEKELDVFYEDVRTELELHEKKIKADGVSAEDVERGTEMLRKLYDNRLGLWATRNAQEFGIEEWNLLAEQSDVLVKDLRGLIASWTARENAVVWSQEERHELQQLVSALRQLPE